MKTAIIGVGNKLMGDEGVGVHAIEYLRGLPPFPSPLTKGEMDILDAGTGGMALLHILENYDEAIIIDAADFGGHPGEVKSFVINPPSPPFAKGGKEDVLPHLKKGGTGGISLAPDPALASLHGASLAGILALAEKLDKKMPKITIIAIQPEYIAPSLELSAACSKALEKIRDVISGHL